MRLHLFVSVMGLLLSCGPQVAVSPSSGSSFGHFEVTVRQQELVHLTDPLSVTVGGVPAYGVVRDAPDTVRFTVQGAPEPGRAEVVVSARDGEAKGGVLTYQPPVDPRFARLVMLGASLTMGMQSAGIGPHGQLHGPAATLARAAGAYLPLPLMKEGYFEGLTLSDIDPVTCLSKSPPTQIVASRLTTTLVPRITDRDGNIVVKRARQTPTLETRNVAIGGYTIGQVLSGGGSGLEGFLEHFVWEPDVPPNQVFDEAHQTMLERVEALQPTLVVSPDLFDNDLIHASNGGKPLTDALTPFESFQPALEQVLSRLSATGAEVFIGNAPDATLMEYFAVGQVQVMRDDGYSEADIQGWLDEVRRRTDRFNAELDAAAARHPRVHVIDLHTALAKGYVTGFDVDGQHLSARRLGGLLSFDNIHFSDTGYALLAQELIDAINRTLGTLVPPVDVSAAHRDDPFSPDTLRAQGLSCAGM